jgi:hypothetical protein
MLVTHALVVARFSTHNAVIQRSSSAAPIASRRGKHQPLMRFTSLRSPVHGYRVFCALQIELTISELAFGEVTNHVVGNLIGQFLARFACKDHPPAFNVFSISGKQLRLPASHFRSSGRSDGVGTVWMPKSAEERTSG